MYTKKEKKEGGENGKCRYKIVSIKNDEKKIIIISKIIQKMNIFGMSVNYNSGIPKNGAFLYFLFKIM